MAALSLETFRGQFPILGRRIYVNSCSQGALSVPVEAALARYVESWHAGGSPWEDWVAQVERLRARAAAAIGADVDELAIMPSASVAISAIATALRFDNERRTVVLGEFEFPTMAHVWLAQQPRGAEIAWAHAQGETLPIEAYAAQIDERTLVVPVTHVCFRNGYRADVPRLVALCRDRGALIFLDDYQRTGTAPLDVHALDVDFLVTGALKYLLGPAGIAFLYVRRALLEQLTPFVTGWFGRANPFAFAPERLDWSSSARRFETGTPPVPNAYAATAGIDLLQQVGFDVVESQVGRLVDRFASGAHDCGFELLTSNDSARRGPLVVVRAVDAGELVRRLGERGVIASARGNGVRVSFHAYNTHDDVDAILRALMDESPLVVRHRAFHSDHV